MKDLTTLSAEAQSVCLRTIREMCRIFWGPEPAHCREMLEGTFLVPFSALTDLFSGAAEVSRLQAFLSGFEDERQLFAELEQAYIRLFISTSGRVIPLYQSCYENDDRLMMGQGAVDMKKRLAASGLAIDGGVNEPPDHLSIELEYLYFLLEAGWQGGDRQSVLAAATFAGGFMLPWVAEFSARLQSENTCRFYPASAALLVRMLEAVARLTAPRQGGANGPSSPDSPPRIS